MSLTSTHFNPFGKYENTVKLIKNEMEAIAERLKRSDDDRKIADILKDVKKYEGMLEKITEVATNIEVHAIKALLCEIAIPFSAFIGDVGNRSPDQLKAVNVNILSRKITRFMQSVADRVVEPYNSELLEEWAPVFQTFLTSQHHSFKENGALLWKKTFGTIKTPLKWPAGLRTTLERIPKKQGIILPLEVRTQEAYLIDDDDAMDGLSVCSGESVKNFKQPGTTKEVIGDARESQSSSFQFSQQASADAVADQLLNERKMKISDIRSPKAVSIETPPRKRAPKISLVDDDSCNYVAIASTPPSGRKNRLTDRQKEILAEAAGPNTSINYMNEESQSGVQKKEKLQNAFSEIFDIGDESCSQPFPKAIEPPVVETEKVGLDESFSYSLRRTSKRSRKLFPDSPVKAPVTTSSDSEKNGVYDTRTSPSKKKSKVEHSQDEDMDATEKSTPENVDGIDDVFLLEKLPKIVEDSNTHQKKRGRPKNSSKQLLPVSSAIARESFLMVSNELKPGTSSESPDTKKEQQEPTLSENISNALDAETHIVVFTDVLNSQGISTGSVGTSSASIKVSEESEAIKSPPKTPRTPSILRVGKRARGLDSPTTDRKKNRVHFGAESLPKESSASPLTPRRRPLAADGTSSTPVLAPLSINPESTTQTKNLLDYKSSKNESMSFAFFPSLAQCTEKIDRIIPNLVTLCRKTNIDSAKKSMQAGNIGTVGEFAQLSKRKIEEFNWIKGRHAGARNALSQFEKTWRSEQKLNAEMEIVSDQVEGNLVNDTESAKKDVEGCVEEDQKNIVNSSNLRVHQNEADTPIETNATTASVDHSKLQESSTTTIVQHPTKSSAPAPNCTEISDSSKEKKIIQTETMVTPQKSPEASQSPASPMATSAVSTAPATPKETSAVVSRKNLAPIFLDKATRMKAVCDSAQQQSEKSLLDDVRQLSRTCFNLTIASDQNKLPMNNSSPLMAKIHRVATFFKYLVQSRKRDEWEDVEFNIMGNEDISVEKEIENLMIIHKRFLRRNAQLNVDALPWSSVLASISESSCLLEGLYRARSAIV